MKRKMKAFVLTATILFLNIPVCPSALAMDGFDMMNNFSMDMILEQSYHTIDSVGFATDLAMDNNALNHAMNEMLFFPDILDVISTANNSHTHHNTDDFHMQDAITAVDNGMWMPEFNNFFNQPTAEIPVDVEMANVNMSEQTVPAFQNVPQDTIGDLPDSSGMDNNHSSALNNQSELHFDSPDDNIATNPDIGGNEIPTSHDPGVQGNVDFVDMPDAGAELTWHTDPHPELAVLDAAQPDINTDMINAIGGEMANLHDNNFQPEIPDMNNVQPEIPDPNLNQPPDMPSIPEPQIQPVHPPNLPSTKE